MAYIQIYGGSGHDILYAVILLLAGGSQHNRVIFSPSYAHNLFSKWLPSRPYYAHFFL